MTNNYFGLLLVIAPPDLPVGVYHQVLRDTSEWKWGLRLTRRDSTGYTSTTVWWSDEVPNETPSDAEALARKMWRTAIGRVLSG